MIQNRALLFRYDDHRLEVRDQKLTLSPDARGAEMLRAAADVCLPLQRGRSFLDSNALRVLPSTLGTSVNPVAVVMRGTDNRLRPRAFNMCCEHAISYGPRTSPTPREIKRGSLNDATIRVSQYAHRQRM